MSNSVSQFMFRPVRLAYQPPASSTFLSEQISHQQPASSTFFSEQTITSHQLASARHYICLPKLKSQSLICPNPLLLLWYIYVAFMEEYLATVLINLASSLALGDLRVRDYIWTHAWAWLAVLY
jgi:hypothetical protein